MQHELLATTYWNDMWRYVERIGERGSCHSKKKKNQSEIFDFSLSIYHHHRIQTLQFTWVFQYWAKARLFSYRKKKLFRLIFFFNLCYFFNLMPTTEKKAQGRIRERDWDSQSLVSIQIAITMNISFSIRLFTHPFFYKPFSSRKNGYQKNQNQNQWERNLCISDWYDNWRDSWYTNPFSRNFWVEVSGGKYVERVSCPWLWWGLLFVLRIHWLARSDLFVSINHILCSLFQYCNYWQSLTTVKKTIRSNHWIPFTLSIW